MAVITASARLKQQAGGNEKLLFLLWLSALKNFAFKILKYYFAV